MLFFLAIIAQLMFSQIFAYSNLHLLCDRGDVFSGEAPVSALPRLLSILANREGLVKYKLIFDKDRDHRCYIKNSVKAELNLTCQRCLEVFQYQVDINTLICPVTGMQEAESLPEPYEPLLLSAETRLRLADLIEDELILAVPDVPKHADVNCAAQLSALRGCAARGLQQETPVSERQNPFAVLAKLKSDQ
jgi:uncharacterized protein